MARSLPKWVGATDDAVPPPRVRLRIFERHEGRCALTGLKIQPGDQWDLDHEKPLILGGANDEDNLRPVLRYAHRVKSAVETKAKAKADRVRQRHLGIEPRKAKLPGSRGGKWKKRIDGSVVRRDEE